jgi:TonB family protein
MKAVVVSLALVCFGSYVQGQEPDRVAKLVKAPKLIIPDEVGIARIDGTLWIGVSLDKTGAVKKIKFLLGPTLPCGPTPKTELKLLEEAVKANLAAATFSPAIKNGNAVEGEVQISLAVGNAYRAALKKRAEEEAKKSGEIKSKSVGGTVLNGRALKLPKPTYPAEARAMQASGAVRIEVLIAEDGSVLTAVPVSGHPLLQPAAADAACHAKFSPTLLSGQPVKVSGIINYNFVR